MPQGGRCDREIAVNKKVLRKKILTENWVLLPKKMQPQKACTQNQTATPRKRLRFGEEEQQNERALIDKISRSKRYDACSDVAQKGGFEPPHGFTRLLP